MRPVSRSEAHIGEWKLSLWADTVEEIFVEAARAMSRTYGLQQGPPGEWTPITLTARDKESLLVDWLNELLGLSEIDNCAYDAVRQLELSGGQLKAEVRGTPVLRWHSPLKAATYHGLQLARHGKRWKAVVLFDV